MFERSPPLQPLRQRGSLLLGYIEHERAWATSEILRRKGEGGEEGTSGNGAVRRRGKKGKKKSSLAHAMRPSFAALARTRRFTASRVLCLWSNVGVANAALAGGDMDTSRAQRRPGLLRTGQIW